MQDYHTAQYGGIVTPEDIKRREEEERKRLEKLERQKNERRCPGCDMKAFPEDSVKLSDMFYHKSCLTCSECERSPDDNTPMMLGKLNLIRFVLTFPLSVKTVKYIRRETTIMLYFSGPKNVDNVFGDEELIPFCKFCFAKKFKISALNIAETVTTVPELVSMSL